MAGVNNPWVSSAILLPLPFNYPYPCSRVGVPWVYHRFRVYPWVSGVLCVFLGNCRVIPLGNGRGIPMCILPYIHMDGFTCKCTGFPVKWLRIVCDCSKPSSLTISIISHSILICFGCSWCRFKVHR